jgi:hypothetical protein
VYFYSSNSLIYIHSLNIYKMERKYAKITESNMCWPFVDLLSFVNGLTIGLIIFPSWEICSRCVLPCVDCAIYSRCVLPCVDCSNFSFNGLLRCMCFKN